MGRGAVSIILSFCDQGWEVRVFFKQAGGADKFFFFGVSVFGRLRAKGTGEEGPKRLV